MAALVMCDFYYPSLQDQPGTLVPGCTSLVPGCTRCTLVHLVLWCTKCMKTPACYLHRVHMKTILSFPTARATTIFKPEIRGCGFQNGLAGLYLRLLQIGWSCL